MTLEVNILLLMLIFILFTVFIYCYDSEERRKRTKLSFRAHPLRSFEFGTNPTYVPNTNPRNIGFNIRSEERPSTVFTPVGAAPGVHSSQPAIYPPQVHPRHPPYPIEQSSAFPTPEASSFRPSAPTLDPSPKGATQNDSQPPSYDEATGHY